MTNSLLTRRSFGTALMCATVAACASEPPAPTMVERGIETSAIVQTVDMVTREVVFRDPSDKIFAVVAGPEVRNLAQVKPGDRVVIEYRQALAVALAAPGTTMTPEAAAAAMRAAPGQRPGAAEASSVRTRVRIEAVDQQKNMVTFIGSRGVSRTVTVRDPSMQEFVRRLRKGDEVDIAYIEAVAIRVEPIAK